VLLLQLKALRAAAAHVEENIATIKVKSQNIISLTDIVS
jgi:hypothetical protein